MKSLNRQKFIVLCLVLAVVLSLPVAATAQEVNDVNIVEDPNLVESIGEWADAGALNEARSGHTVTLLPDGRVLVTGGHNESGLLASAEIYDPTSKMTTVVASSLATPRTGHKDILLEDGRVLFVGGEGADGALDSAEVFDPSSETFVSVAPMNVPRLNHTVTLLPDGHVLIAGGNDGVGPVPWMEIFDPNSGNFILREVTLLEARESHTATLLEDGQVLVGGGCDGTGTLATTEYIDPNALSVEPGPILTQARYGHTATRLISGSVALVYGTDGTWALNTAEILVPDFNDVFMIVNNPNDPNLGRYSHAAVLLPQNGNLLLLGGYSEGGVAKANTPVELLNPRTYEFSPVGGLQNARADCGVVADAGFVWAIGGTGLNETPLANIETFRYAMLITDQIDYPENSDVIFMGSGWVPGETVEIVIEESDDVNSTTTLVTVADANGNIFNQQFNVGPDNAGVSFIATATGTVSGHVAIATFCDSPYISYLDPSVFPARGADVSLTIHGSGFKPGNLVSNTVYIWGQGVYQTLAIVSQTDSTIVVTIPSSIANQPGDYSIEVEQVTETCGESWRCGSYCCDWDSYCWCCGPFFCPCCKICCDQYCRHYCPLYCCWETDHYSNTITLTIAPANQPPVANAGPDQTVEQTSYQGAQVTLDGSGSTDDGWLQPLRYTWYGAGCWLGTGVSLTVTLPLGTTVVRLSVDDRQYSSWDYVSITVVDTTPPVITLNGAASITLECGIDSYTEPGATATDICDPNVPVIIGGDTVDTSTCGTYIVTYNATDNSGNAATQVTRTVTVQDTTPPVITLNGAASMTLECGIDNYAEQGATATDICDPDVPVIIGGDTVDTSKCGTYIVTYDATDASGNAATQVTRTVTVQDTTPPVISNVNADYLLAAVGQTVTFFADVLDDCDSDVDLQWNFGDGTPSSPNPSHEYTVPGIYLVAVTATDDCNNSSTDSIIIVVYDPSAGFTTGGGWFVPDAGSFIDGIDVTDTVSKANFGFIVKYRKGADNPDGNLEFQYKAGDINLHSSDMEWLVVQSTTKVRFKGLATINGEGLYTFKVTAEDNGEPGTADWFKIEIWMGPDVDTENSPPTPKHKAQGYLGGGNIQIHQK